MNRRAFVVTGGVLLGGGAPRGTERDRVTENPESSASLSRSATLLHAPLDELTIVDLQRMMSSGEQTSRSITQLYLERIDSLDKKGPELRHMLETC